MQDLVERSVSVAVVRDFCEVGGNKCGKRDAVVVAFAHGVNDILQIHLRRIFTGFSASRHKSETITFADRVEQRLFCVENIVGRVKSIANGDNVV